MTPKPVEFSRFLAFLQEQTRRVSMRRCRTEKLDHRQRYAHREPPGSNVWRRSALRFVSLRIGTEISREISF
jgi:hypothetical protein